MCAVAAASHGESGHMSHAQLLPPQHTVWLSTCHIVSHITLGVTAPCHRTGGHMSHPHCCRRITCLGEHTNTRAAVVASHDIPRAHALRPHPPTPQEHPMVVIARAHALLPPHLMMHVNPRCCRRRINGVGEHASGARCCRRMRYCMVQLNTHCCRHVARPMRVIDHSCS